MVTDNNLTLHIGACVAILYRSVHFEKFGLYGLRTHPRTLKVTAVAKSDVISPPTRFSPHTTFLTHLGVSRIMLCFNLTEIYKLIEQERINPL